jgi:hypothetical protein
MIATQWRVTSGVTCVAARGGRRRRRRGEGGGTDDVTGCHASAGTCSAINISLGVIYAYRPRGNALSTEHEKAIVFSHWTWPSSHRDREADADRKGREKESKTHFDICQWAQPSRLAESPGLPLFRSVCRNKRQLFFGRGR